MKNNSAQLDILKSTEKYKLAVEQEPDNWQAHYNLAIIILSFNLFALMLPLKYAIPCIAMIVSYSTLPAISHFTCQQPRSGILNLLIAILLVYFYIVMR